ncbi:hypothetical protein Bca4012_063748 [Brassica carinata]|uniref:Uncharacterized protein n=1 Tax=Brassica carinata TaxID=52824 RepID=A0A8X7V779_BRACI|nr:hypothetical protein Bca52824_033348 [Brassica carinata]
MESVSNMSESRSDFIAKCSARNESVYSVEIPLETSQSPQHFTCPPRIYASSEDNEETLKDGVAFDSALIQILGDMDPWLLPLKPPEDPDYHRKIVNDSYYKDAVAYMRLTIQSPRYVSLAALHPAGAVITTLLQLQNHNLFNNPKAKALCSH